MQCEELTKKGTRCKNSTFHQSSYCRIHQGSKLIIRQSKERLVFVLIASSVPLFISIFQDGDTVYILGMTIIILLFSMIFVLPQYEYEYCFDGKYLYRKNLFSNSRINLDTIIKLKRNKIGDYAYTIYSVNGQRSEIMHSALFSKKDKELFGEYIKKYLAKRLASFSKKIKPI